MPCSGQRTASGSSSAERRSSKAREGSGEFQQARLIHMVATNDVLPCEVAHADADLQVVAARTLFQRVHCLPVPPLQQGEDDDHRFLHRGGVHQQEKGQDNSGAFAALLLLTSAARNGRKAATSPASPLYPWALLADRRLIFLG